MALDPSTEFVGKITAPDANYPYGSARDITVPGDGTGTPLLAVLVNDIFGFQQALLTEADGIVPSGNPDTVLASDYLDAINIIKKRLQNNEFMIGRNFADSAFIDLIGLNALDIIDIGDGARQINILTTRMTVGADAGVSDQNVAVFSNSNADGGTEIRIDRQATARTARISFNDEWFTGILRSGGSSSEGFAIGRGTDITVVSAAFQIDTSDNVFIPNGSMKIGSVTTITPDAGADDFVIDTGAANTGMSILSSGSGNIFFGDAGGVSPGQIVYSHLDDSMTLVTGSVPRVVIDQGMKVGSPAGGDKGTGSINVESLYIEGVALTSNTWTKHPTVHTGVSSGTSIAWTAIPSWATNIKIVYADHSWNGGADIALRLGDSGGFEASGYSGRASKADIGTDWSTQAIISKALVAGDVSNGEIHIVNITGNQWGINSTGLTETGQFFIAGGAKSTSATMDRVQIISEDGTSTFDGGGNYALYYQ